MPFSTFYYPLDPCFTTNTIDEWKRSVANPDYNDIYDNLLILGWYRIISGAGEKMPTTCPFGGCRCGITSPMWLSSSKYGFVNRIMTITIYQTIRTIHKMENNK